MLAPSAESRSGRTDAQLPMVPRGIFRLAYCETPRQNLFAKSASALANPNAPSLLSAHTQGNMSVNDGRFRRQLFEFGAYPTNHVFKCFAQKSPIVDEPDMSATCYSQKKEQRRNTCIVRAPRFLAVAWQGRLYRLDGPGIKTILLSAERAFQLVRAVRRVRPSSPSVQSSHAQEPTPEFFRPT
jgi:hypothetical protein